jgi:hypothetical protein
MLFLILKIKQMEKTNVKKFWWEEDFGELLRKYNQEEVGEDTIRLFIVKVAGIEKGVIEKK